MKQKDLYWMAGIIEGEGSIYINNKSATLEIAMSDRDIVKRIVELWGNGKIFTHTPKSPKGSNYKTMHVITKKGYPALMIMQLIYPIMGDRRKEQIEKCFNLYDYDVHKKLPLKSKIGQKITGAQIKNILKRHKQGESPYKIAKDYPFSGSYLSNICHGRRAKCMVVVKNNNYLE